MTHSPAELADHGDEFCPSCWAWDPLARIRAAGDPPLDVLVSGMVFFDIVFTGLDRLPKPGEELWSQGLGSCPGGIANLATASARLGLRTGLVAGFGDDTYADWIWETLAEQERIDLTASRRFQNFHTSLTVSMATPGDRAMVTHGHRMPFSLDDQLRKAPAARAAVIGLDDNSTWWAEPERAQMMLFADVGFDASGSWDRSVLANLEHCHAFTPNAVEAMAYTRTETPSAAVRKLADLVPLAVVTDGAQGSYAIDQTTGESAYCPALSVPAIDATGAGDVFAASLLLGTLADWPLTHRLSFASLSSALAVQQFGGSLSAPGWGDITDWWHCLEARASGGDLRAEYLRADYGFLSEIVPMHKVQGVRRAQGTFALASDAGHH